MGKLFKSVKSATAAAIVGLVLMVSGVSVAALSGDATTVACSPADACPTTTTRPRTTTTTARPTTTTARPTTTTTQATTTTTQATTTTTKATTTTQPGATTTQPGSSTTTEATTTTQPDSTTTTQPGATTTQPGSSTTTEATTTTSSPDSSSTTDGAEVLGETVTSGTGKPLPATGFPIGIAMAIAGALLLVGGLMSRSAQVHLAEVEGGETTGGSNQG